LSWGGRATPGTAGLKKWETEQREKSKSWEAILCNWGTNTINKGRGPLPEKWVKKMRPEMVCLSGDGGEREGKISSK